MFLSPDCPQVAQNPPLMESFGPISRSSHDFHTIEFGRLLH
jgi:hypothetical protein